MPAIIELRDTRAFHAAAKIWGYVRDNANSLDGARHMAFVKAAIENATQKERETSDALRQENETLRWLFAKAIYNSAETVMKKRREGKLDGEIREAFHKRGCTIKQLAQAYRCNDDTIRRILGIKKSEALRSE